MTFAIDGPALVSFSGGRTSGYMLRRILDAGLRPDVHVAFANTGKERSETLDFIEECSHRWGVRIRWLEYRTTGYVEVDYQSASRDGTPFAQLISARKYLPNPVTRFCTQELKIRIIRDFMRGQGYEHWDNVIGIRADEPRRVARMRAPNAERWETVLPLADAGVTLDEVTQFWQAQPFDLQLRPWEGNCDLCFLKARSKRERIIHDRPDLAGWWIEQEERVGATFRQGSSYSLLARSIAAQTELPFVLDDDIEDCVCNA